MANGDDQSKKLTPFDLKITQENVDLLKEELGITSRITEQRRAGLSVAKQLASQAQDVLASQDGSARSIKEINKELDRTVKLQKIAENLINTGVLDGRTKEARLLKSSASIGEVIIKQLRTEAEEAENINEALGLSGKALSVVNKLFKGTLGDTGGILQNVRDQLKGQSKSNMKMKAFGLIINQVGKNIVTSLVDPLTAVLLLLENSTAINNFQKNLGIGFKNSVGLRNEMSRVAANTGDAFITSEKLQTSFMNMSESLGFVADFSGQTLETMTNLEQRLGLASGEAAQLTALFRLQGDNTEDIASNTFDALTSSIKLGNVDVNPKQVFAEISKTTDSIKVALGANPEAIGRAVVAAKQLGAELSDIDNIAGNILNFEQSISSELEAELLTGKQLNLERARLLALNNDLEGVAKEITKQGIDFASFSEMNRIQQESIASSLGLSRDELSKITLQQQLQTMSSEEIKNNFGEGAYQQALALSASEKFEAVLSKIKGLGSDLLVILTPFIDLLALIATPIAAVVGGIGSLVSGITSTFVSAPMAMGGIVPARAGGTLATIGEAGQAEAIIPLSRAGEFGLGGTEINYDKMAMAMSKAQVNVTTKYNSFRAYSTTSNGGRYQSSARYESKFV